MEPSRGALPAATIALALLTGLFIFLLALTKIANYDIWYHMATGRYILESGFPASDPFSYTQPHAPMYLLSWLAGILFYLIWKAGGLGGLTVAKALLAVALFALLWQAARHKVPGHRAFGLVATTTLVVGAFGLKFRLFMRPHLIELLLLAGFLLVLDRYRWRARVLLPTLGAMQLIWVNVHGSFPLGVGLPLAFLAGDVLDARAGRPIELGRAARVAGLTVVCLLAASALNPASLRGLAAPLVLAGWGRSLLTIGEYQPMRLSHLVGFGLRYTWGFSALAVLGLSGLAAGFIKGRRPPAWEPLVFGLFLVVPLVAGLRFIAEFVVVASPLVAGWWLRILPSPKGESRLWPAAEVALGLALLPLWWVAIAQSPIYEVGLGEKREKFPARAVAFLKEVRPSGPLFNSIGFGGYLIWHLPSRKVFIDGRLLVYPEEFYRLYRRAHTDPQAWRQIEEAYGPEVVVLEYLTDKAGKERMPHLESSARWALVFWDPVAKIYLKRTQANAPIISRHEYRLARPAYFSLAHLLGILKDRARLGEALAEYERVLGQNPSNLEARLALAFLKSFGAEPDWDRALEALGPVLKRMPYLAKAHATACRAYLGKGLWDRARLSCLRALQLNSKDPMARWAYAVLRGSAPGGIAHPRRPGP
jgi:tetratricopeptide (TPR) repeat protein